MCLSLLRLAFQVRTLPYCPTLFSWLHSSLVVHSVPFVAVRIVLTSRTSRQPSCLPESSNSFVPWSSGNPKCSWTTVSMVTTVLYGVLYSIPPQLTEPELNQTRSPVHLSLVQCVLSIRMRTPCRHPNAVALASGCPHLPHSSPSE